MADGTQDGAATGANSDGNAAPANKRQQDDRATWSQQDWEKWANQEADRRTSKTVESLTAKLADTKTSAESRVADALAQAQAAQADAKLAKVRADFIEAATTAGVSDVSAAWAVASAESLISDKGTADFEKLKSAHPALFGGVGTKPDAAGRQQDVGQGGKTRDMNKIIRSALLANTAVAG